MLEIVADLLLVLGAIGLAGYCFVLSRRLKRLSRADEGIGASVAELSKRVEQLTETATRATSDAEAAATRLAKMITEAERYEGELAFLLAGSEDPEGASMTPREAPEPEPGPPVASVEPVFASRAGSLGR